MILKRISIIFWNVMQLVFKANIWSTIYFNFKVLPFNQAIKFPFHFYGKTDFVNLTGKFEIQTKEIHFGMIVFGGKHEVVISSNVPTRIYNSGTIIFKSNALFARGINLMVWKNATLEFGNHFSIGSLSNIICFRKITFGSNILISWECQIFDTDFHFIVQNENTVKDNCGEVIIEDDTWIGARATILKNTTLAKKTIVGANSVCSGDYKEKHGEGILIAGVPAKFIKGEVAYLTNKKKELELFDYFSIHQKQEIHWKH